MEVIRHFVGIGPDQGTFDFVDRRVEHVQRDRFQLIRECLFETRIEEPPEGPAPTHDVLPQARLAFVNAGGGPAGERRALVFPGHPLLVQGVARLVHHAEKRLSQVVFLDARGDAHVAEGEPGHEGMRGHVAPPALEIVAETFDDLISEGQLPSLGKAFPQTRIVRRRLRRDRLNKRNKLHPKLVEDTAQHRNRHALISKVNERVGDMLVAGKEVGQFTAEVNRLFEQRLDGLKVVCRTRFDPGRVRAGHVLGQPRREL